MKINNFMHILLLWINNIFQGENIIREKKEVDSKLIRKVRFNKKNNTNPKPIKRLILF